MSPEHNLRSIPPRTFRDTWRGRGNQTRFRVNQIGFGGISFGGTGIGKIGQEGFRQDKVDQEWMKTHVFQKPVVEKPKSFVVSYEDRQIEWQTDIIGEYKGSFIIIVQFPGLDLSRASFVRSDRDYGPNAAVFYSRVGYKGKLPFLVIAADYDILEAQVVPRKKDQDPLFQGEIYVRELADYDATTMTITPKNGVVTVGYQKR